MSARTHVPILVGQSDADVLLEHSRELMAAFGRRGLTSEIVDLRVPEFLPALVRAVEGGHVRFCTAFSGFGATLEANGTLFWDLLRVPVVGLMPDNPVYEPQRHRLSSPHVLLLYNDADHAAISGALSGGAPRGIVGITGTSPDHETLRMARRDIPLLYAKSGGDPAVKRASWRALPDVVRAHIEAIADECCWKSDISVWDVAHRRLKDAGIDLSGPPTDAVCFIVREADWYVRMARASRLLKELLALPVVVTGGDWDHLDWSRAKARRAGRLGLHELREAFGRTKLVVNMLPAVRHTSHHRVAEGMLWGAAAFTDCNTWLDENIGPAAYVDFDWTPGAIRAAAEEALRSDDTLDEVASRGRAAALRHHTSEVVIRKLLETVDAYLSTLSQ